MKQVVLSITAVAIAAAILVGMVMYTVSFLRLCQQRVLTGDFPSSVRIAEDRS